MEGQRVSGGRALHAGGHRPHQDWRRDPDWRSGSAARAKTCVKRGSEGPNADGRFPVESPSIEIDRRLSATPSAFAAVARP
jgi:hypothetical protein